MNGDRSLIVGLKELGFTDASLSIAHWNPETNRSIMQFKGRFQGMTEEEIEMFAQLRNDKFSPRLSCILTPEGVWQSEDIENYVQWGENLGIRRFIFRGDFNIPPEFSRKIRQNCPQDIDLIEATLIHKSRKYEWQSIGRLHKSDLHVHGLTNGISEIWLDVSSEELDPDRKIRRLIIMPNGIAFTSWINPYSVLFDEALPYAHGIAERQLPHLKPYADQLYAGTRKTLSL